MKRYLLFSGHYVTKAAGGWTDFDGSFDSAAECGKYLHNNPRWEWWHIVDGKTGEIIQRKQR